MKKIKAIKVDSNDIIFGKFKNNPEAAADFIAKSMSCESCCGKSYCNAKNTNCFETLKSFFKTFGAKYLDDTYSFARFLDDMIVCDNCPLKGTNICSADISRSNCIHTWKKYLDSEGDKRYTDDYNIKIYLEVRAEKKED